MKRIEIIQADITQLQVDAIVNAANNSLMGGGGVDGAIHQAAGMAMTDECRTLRGCKTGQSKITNGYNLPAKYVIHTVGPVWVSGNQDEGALLASCYRTALELASEYGIKTIAFPSISTGAYRFPFDKAAKIAQRVINEFLQQDETIEKVFLVCFSDQDFNQMQRILGGS